MQGLARGVMAGMAGVLLAACADEPAPAKARPLPTVEVTGVREIERAATLSAIGTLRANESLMVRPEISARVVSLGFREGQPVRRGQLLVQLDDAQARADMASVEAALALARSELRRATALPADLIARHELERLQAQLAMQQAALARARAVLAKTRILAPFDGVAGLRLFSPGEVVQPGQDLFSLTALQPMKLDVPVPESRAGDVRVGQVVSATIAALPEAAVTGRVAAMEPALDAGSRALRLRVLIDNPGGRLQPGMTARISLATSAPVRVRVVPDQAVVPMGGRQVVFVLGEKNVATAVAVQPGLRVDGLTEIGDALALADQVVVSGQNKLNKPSQPVRPIPFPADGADVMP